MTKQEKQQRLGAWDSPVPQAPSGLRGPTGTGHELALDRYIGTVAIVVRFLDDVTDPVSVEQAVNDHLVDFGEEVVQAVLVSTSPGTAAGGTVADELLQLTTELGIARS